MELQVLCSPSPYISADTTTTTPLPAKRQITSIKAGIRLNLYICYSTDITHLYRIHNLASFKHLASQVSSLQYDS